MTLYTVTMLEDVNVPSNGPPALSVLENAHG